MNEQRLLTGEEFATSAAFGGIAGGGIRGGIEGVSALRKNFKKYSIDEALELFGPEETQNLLKQGKLLNNGERIPKNALLAFTERRTTLRNKLKTEFRDDFITKVNDAQGPDFWQVTPATRTDWVGYPITLGALDEEQVINSLAISVKRHGINPNDLLTDKMMRSKDLPRDIGNVYLNYAKAYYEKWGTLDGIDKLQLPDGTEFDIQARKENFRRKYQAKTENPEGSAAEFYEVTPELKEEISLSLNMGGENLRLEAHHISGLQDASYLWAGLGNIEGKKVTDYLLKQHYIWSGDTLGNRALLDQMGVHNPLHQWMKKNIPQLSDDDKAAIARIPTAKGRQKYIDKYAANVQKSQEKIFELVQRWKLLKDYDKDETWTIMKTGDMDELVSFLDKYYNTSPWNITKDMLEFDTNILDREKAATAKAQARAKKLMEENEAKLKEYRRQGWFKDTTRHGGWLYKK